MSHIRVAMFSVVLVDNRIRYDFKKTRTVDGFVVRKTYARCFINRIFDMEIRQPVYVCLIPVVVSPRRGVFQMITLVGALHTKSCNEMPMTYFISYLCVAGTDMFGGIVIERIA